MTDLFLFRHAAAELASAADIEAFGAAEADARRALTPKGRRKFRKLVEDLAGEDVRFDVLLHSPWRRAVETAELLVPLTRGRTEVVSALAAPPGPELDAALVGTRVALVGHEPWLGQLVARLTHAPEGLLLWKKGGLVWLRRITPVAPWQLAAVRSP